MAHVILGIVVLIVVVRVLLRVLQRIVICAAADIAFENVVRVRDLRKHTLSFRAPVRVLVWVPFAR